MNSDLRNTMVRDDCHRVLQAHVSGLESLRGGVMLVTGGTGFMGTWLAETVAYLNDCHRYGIQLRLLSAHAGEFASRAPHLAARRDIRLIEQDVLNVVELPADVAWLIHAAADPDSGNHATDPLRTLRVIARGTDAVLQAATRLGSLRKVLHISSGMIYGAQPLDLAGLPESFVGGCDCSVPGRAYAEGKRVAETICAAYRTQMRLPIVMVRPFAFIGPHQPLDRSWAANSFIRDALCGGPIRIQGDGATVRSYLYPADMAHWLLGMLAQAASGSVYNLGSPQGVTLMELAQLITSSLPQPVKITTRLLGANAPGTTRFVPDVALAASTLGLRIQTDLQQTVRQAIQWYRAQ